MAGLQTRHFFDDGNTVHYWNFTVFTPVVVGPSCRLVRSQIMAGTITDNTFALVPNVLHSLVKVKSYKVQEGSYITRTDLVLLQDLPEGMIIALAQLTQEDMGSIVPLFVPEGSDYKIFTPITLFLDPKDFESEEVE